MYELSESPASSPLTWPSVSHECCHEPPFTPKQPCTGTVDDGLHARPLKTFLEIAGEMSEVPLPPPAVLRAL